MVFKSLDFCQKPVKNENIVGEKKSSKNFLKEYYQRENSESGIARDKEMFGWKVGQEREDRVDKAVFATTIWYNLLLL